MCVCVCVCGCVCAYACFCVKAIANEDTSKQNKNANITAFLRRCSFQSRLLHRCIYNYTKHQSEVPKRNKIEASSLTPTHRSNDKNKSQEIRQHSERLCSAALARCPRDRPARLTAAFAPIGRLGVAFAPIRRFSVTFAQRCAAFSVGDTCMRRQDISS